MVRQRFIYCGIAAAFILSGEARAQEDIGLRTSLDASEPSEEQPQPIMVATPPTTLEVNPSVEPPPSPRKRRRASEEVDDAGLGIDAGGFTIFPVMRVG